MFAIEEAGRSLSSFADLCPGFTAQDRLGIVVREPLAGTRNSAFILAAVTGFYDEQRERSSEFFTYPDYFVFHAGCEAADYAMFDVWPQHKCIVVEDHPEAIFRAINDRAITILLLSQPVAAHSAERQETLQLQTRNSALSRIRHAFIQLQEARTDAIGVIGNETTKRYVESVLAQSSGVSEDERELVRLHHSAATAGGPIKEWYGRLAVEAALVCV